MRPIIRAYICESYVTDLPQSLTGPLVWFTSFKTCVKNCNAIKVSL